MNYCRHTHTHTHAYVFSLQPPFRSKHHEQTHSYKYTHARILCELRNLPSTILVTQMISPFQLFAPKSNTYSYICILLQALKKLLSTALVTKMTSPFRLFAPKFAAMRPGWTAAKSAAQAAAKSAAAPYPPVPGSPVPICVGEWVCVCGIYVCINTHVYMCGVVSSGPWESSAHLCEGVQFPYV